MPTESSFVSTGDMVKLVTSTSLIIIDDDIVKAYINPETEFGNIDADENVEAVLSRIGSKKIYSLVVPDATTHITVEARSYRNEAYEKQKLGEAIVVKELAHRILAKAYIGVVGKTSCPTRIFNSESEAIDWLKSLKESN